MQREFAPNAGQVPAIFVVAPEAAQVQDDPIQPAELCRAFRHGKSRMHGISLLWSFAFGWRYRYWERISAPDPSALERFCIARGLVAALAGRAGRGRRNSPAVSLPSALLSRLFKAALALLISAASMTPS